MELKDILLHLVGPIIIGVCAIGGAYWSVSKTFKKQEQRDRNRQEEIIKAVLQAIYEELNVLWEAYNKELGVHWEEFKEGEALLVRVSLSEDYFTIYRSNANLIGQIPDSNLRVEIVKVYTYLKVLADSYKLNSILVDRYDLADSIGYTKLADNLLDQLQNYAPILKGKHDHFGGSMEGLFEILKGELARRRTKRYTD